MRAAPKGMTMDRLVKDCGKVSGWNIVGWTPYEVVRLVLQTLMDDGLAVLRSRFELTPQGRRYLEDPLKWRIEADASEDVEKKLFWKSIYEVFERARARMRAKPQGGTSDSQITAGRKPQSEQS